MHAYLCAWPQWKVSVLKHLPFPWHFQDILHLAVVIRRVIFLSFVTIILRQQFGYFVFERQDFKCIRSTDLSFIGAADSPERASFPLRPPPQILHNYCFQFLRGVTVVPREIEDNGCGFFFLGGGGLGVGSGKQGALWPMWKWWIRELAEWLDIDNNDL